MKKKSEKKLAIADLQGILSNAKGAVFADYRGITVAQDTKLRRKMREAGVEYRVVKNTLLRIAADQVGVDGLEKYLEGPTAMAVSESDPVVAAKLITDFAKENKVLDVKAGLVEGRVIDVNGVKALAVLPSREVLVAKALGSMQAPISGLVNVLHGSIRNLVYTLEAVRKEKESA